MSLAEAFVHCLNLGKILIILGNIEIGPYPFLNCISLNNITLLGNLTFTLLNIFDNIKNNNILIYYYGSKFVENIVFVNV
jgi:hypothetical protein